jgi:hypothetical protein
MDVSKIDAVTSWPTPKSARGLRGFLGLDGYYRRFIHNFGAITSPLTQLLKKNAFQWSDSADSAFKALIKPSQQHQSFSCQILNSPSLWNVMPPIQDLELFCIRARDHLHFSAGSSHRGT